MTQSGTMSPILSSNDLPLVLFAYFICTEDVFIPPPHPKNCNVNIFLANWGLPTTSHAGSAENRQYFELVPSFQPST